MIKIRNLKTKKEQILDSNHFVEICNGIGELITVLHISDSSEIVAIRKNTPEGLHYSRISGQRFSDFKPVIIKK